MMNPGLTSFRFFAFFAVFLLHSLHLHIGYLGVSAFFVLSGFLITAILVEMKDTHHGKHYFLQFYARRTLRIFPLYYFYLLGVALLLLLFVGSTNTAFKPASDSFFQQLPWGLTYTYDFYNASDAFEHNRLISHFWSLAIEEQFYLLWPLAIYFVAKKHLKKFLLLVSLAGPLLRYLTACAAQNHWIPGIGDRVDLVVYVSPFSHLDAFAIGGYFALYGQSGSTTSISGFATVLIAVGLLTAAASGHAGHWSSFGYDSFMADSFKYIWGYTLFNLFFAHTLVTIKHEKFLPGLMNSPILVYLGTISYGLYVYHEAWLWLLTTACPQLPVIAIFIFALALTIGISAVSYAVLEQPFIRLKDRFFARQHKGP